MLTPFTSQSLSDAAKALADGKLVSFATETVYGLGADATNDKAVANIYAAKGRPSFNPLIAHVADLEQARSLGQFNDTALAIADAFWPGAISLVVPLQNDVAISKLVTAGLPSIALRMPAPVKVREMIKLAGVPIAAPSANLSGKISPTTAEHVAQSLDSACAYILDDGPCEAGLESTIIDCTAEEVRILRPGPITAEDLLEKIPNLQLRETQIVNDHAPSAPGQLTSHYAPKKRLELDVIMPSQDAIYIGFGANGHDNDLNLSPSGDLVEAAANLFAMLHIADALEGDHIAVAPITSGGLGTAIYDRLQRAAADK